jgi:thymidylate synthase
MIFHSKNCHVYERQYNLVKELIEPKKSDASRISKTIADAKKEKIEE